MTGWIRLDRKIFDNEDLFPFDKPLTEGEAWLRLLCMVDYHTGSIRKPERYFAKVFNWAPSKTHRFLSKLVRHNMVQRSEQDKSEITVVNWAKYQGAKQDVEQEPEHKPERIKKTINNKQEQKKVSKKTRLQADWQIPIDYVDYAVSKGMTQEQAYEEGDKFLAYHLGKGSLQLDWKATWRTWVLNGYWKNDSTAKRNQSKSKTDEFFDFIDTFEKERTAQ